VVIHLSYLISYHK